MSVVGHDLPKISESAGRSGRGIDYRRVEIHRRAFRHRAVRANVHHLKIAEVTAHRHVPGQERDRLSADCSTQIVNREFSALRRPGGPHVKRTVEWNHLSRERRRRSGVDVGCLGHRCAVVTPEFRAGRAGVGGAEVKRIIKDDRICGT